VSDEELAEVLSRTQGGWQTPDVSFANVTIEGALFVVDSVDGAFVHIYNNPLRGPDIEISPPTRNGINLQPGDIAALTDSSSGQPVDILNIHGPVDASSAGGTILSPLIQFLSGTPTAPKADTLVIDAQSVQWIDEGTGSFQSTMSGGGDFGHGIVANVISASDSGTITTTEGVLITVPSRFWVGGRSYRLDVQGRFAPSVAGNGPTWRVRKNNVAGTSLFSQGRTPNNGSGESPPPPSFFFNVPTSVTCALALTLTADSGTVVQRGPRGVIVTDVGPDTATSGLPSLV